MSSASQTVTAAAPVPDAAGASAGAPDSSGADPAAVLPPPEGSSPDPSGDNGSGGNGGNGGNGSDFCRVVVAGPNSRADLAVPLRLPLVRLMPSLVEHAGEEIGSDGGAGHEGWVLRTAAGARLDGARSLGAQDVREGDTLFLAHGAPDAPPPLYDDVVEALTAGGVRSPWPSAAVRRTAGAFAAVAVVGATAAIAAAPAAAAGFLGLAACLLGLGMAALLSRAFADTAGGTCAAVLAVPPAAVGAVHLLGGGVGGGMDVGSAHLLLACAVVAVLGAVGPMLVGGGDAAFAVLVIGGVFGSIGAFVATMWDTTPAQAVSVVAPLALALTTLWPALALRVAHIPGPQLAATPEELEELPDPPGHDALRLRVNRARGLLTGMLGGSLLVVVVGALVLLGSGGLWASVLAGVLALVGLLRGRLFRESAQVGVSLAAGLAVLLGAAVLLAHRFAGESMPLLGVLLPVCVVVALVSCVVGLLSGRRSLNPRLSRTLDSVETMLLLSLIPLVLAVWEVYTALLRLNA